MLDEYFKEFANKISNCFSFEFRLRVCLATDGDLTLISRVRNVNGKPFSFSFAYHTHLLVSDIRYGLLFSKYDFSSLL